MSVNELSVGTVLRSFKSLTDKGKQQSREIRALVRANARLKEEVKLLEQAKGTNVREWAKMQAKYARNGATMERGKIRFRVAE